ncbi:MAG TPA: LysR family transcriptional regulator [Casimicrobiaceae bacterium]|nr:LysR family transcriptional regulator [Casimicrobiaceae bacterium]
MNLQQLGYFVAVAHRRNFTHAAESCFVAQPALSQQIRKLEDELGLPVFERRTRGVDLTAAGSAFLAYAEQVLKLVAEGKQHIVDLQKMRHGVVSLVCLPTIATYWLPRIISSFRVQFPEVQIQIHEHPGCTPQDFGDAVADLGIVQLPDGPPERDGASVQIDRLFVDEQVLIVPSTHRLARTRSSPGEAIPLRQAAGEAFVLPKPTCGMSRVISKAFSEAGFQPRVRLETSQLEAVCEMVSAGLGVGLMPALAMHRDHPNLCWRRVKKPVPKRTIALARRSERGLSPAAAAFAEIVRDTARRGEEAIDKASRATRKSRAVVHARRATASSLRAPRLAK